MVHSILGAKAQTLTERKWGTRKGCTTLFKSLAQPPPRDFGEYSAHKRLIADRDSMRIWTFYWPSGS